MVAGTIRKETTLGPSIADALEAESRYSGMSEASIIRFALIEYLESQRLRRAYSDLQRLSPEQIRELTGT